MEKPLSLKCNSMLFCQQEGETLSSLDFELKLPSELCDKQAECIMKEYKAPKEEKNDCLSDLDVLQYSMQERDSGVYQADTTW